MIVGLGLLVGLAALSVPIVGVQTWLVWPTGLQAFAATLATFPIFKGLAIERWQGPIVALAISLLVVGFALLGRDRNGLARFGRPSRAAIPLRLDGYAPPLGSCHKTTVRARLEWTVGSLLRRILGELVVPQDPVGHRVQTTARAASEAREGLLVAVLRSNHEIGVHVPPAIASPDGTLMKYGESRA